MGLCKGNTGNLLQHWVLCEALNALFTKGIEHLHLSCTHSMAPWSIPDRIDYAKNHSPRLHQRRYFDRVRNRLTANNLSAYENCWKTCSGSSGLPYPSSAVLAAKLWKTKLSLFLCEMEDWPAIEIDAWMNLPEVNGRIERESRLHRGDWRTGLTDQVFSSSIADCFLIELDPMQFECVNPTWEDSRNGALLYPDDIQRVLACVRAVQKPVLIQVSTYNTQNDNSIDRVGNEITPYFSNAGFRLEAYASPHGSMKSWLFTRGLQLWNQSGFLQTQFDNWLPR